MAEEDRRQDLTAAGDAVGKSTQADDEGQHPDNHHRAGDRMRAGDKPGHRSNNPTADDSAPEDDGDGANGGFESKA